MPNSDERMVVLVDMDCFFCQVEVKLQPEFKGKPLAVVQYTPWQSGGIIAVNYEARDHGVSRHMRAEEAKKKCPELVLATVPGVRGKPDTSRYRIAGREVVDVLRKHSTVIERASVDEAYLDITELVNQEMASTQPSAADMANRLPNSFVIGYSTVGDNDEAHRREAVENWVTAAYGELGDIQARRLAVAGTIVERIRADVYDTTGYRCSAGVSFNKILAKLACGLHKPNRQTILPLAGVPSLYQTLPIKKVRNLGGKFGDVVIESLGCNVMADLLSYSLKDLQTRFDDKTGLWLYNIARGVDNEPVTTRLIPKSIGSCKNFPGKQAIVTKEMLEHWVEQLSLDMNHRLVQDLEENKRKATLLTISYHYYKDNKTVSQSRSCRLTSNKAEIISKNCFDIVSKFASKYPIVFMGMSASKFIDIDKETTSFRNFFTASTDACSVVDELSVSGTTSAKEKTCSVSPKSEEMAAPAMSNNVRTDEMEIKDELRIFPSARCPISSSTVEIAPVCDTEDKNVISTSLAESNQEIKSPMSLLRTENAKLKPDNFKKSFFMNILNANKNNEDPPAVDNTEVERVPKPSCTEFHTDLSTDKSTESETLARNSGEEEFCKTIEEECSIASNSKTGTESEEVVRPTSPANPKHDSHHWVNTETETVDEGDRDTIKLQDIFPDLNNLDESIVAVLPPRLQREANLILQSQKKKVTESKPNSAVKSSQQKGKEQKRSRTKPTAQSRINKIDTFFNNETKSVRDSTDNELMEKCPDCNRLIPLNEYLEHVDFHVARKLSKEINKSVAGGTMATPENDRTWNVKPTKRKRNKPETREPEKRSKGIAAFFS